MDLSFMNRPLEVKEELPSRRQAVELQIRKHAIRKSAVSRREEKTLVFVEEEDIILWPILMNFVRKSSLD